MWRTFGIEFLNFGVQRHFQQYFSYRVYHGDQFKWWRKPEYPERTTDPGQATGKLYHLRLRVECTLFVINKLCASPRRIGDRLVWVVKSNDLNHWATLKDIWRYVFDFVMKITKFCRNYSVPFSTICLFCIWLFLSVVDLWDHIEAPLLILYMIIPISGRLVGSYWSPSAYL